MDARSHVTLAVLAALAIGSLGGCKPAATNSLWNQISPPPHGRYVGVGIYNPGKQWTRMVTAQEPTDDGSAQPIDDQVVLVVTDSATGEIRACGDLTGYCIGMNPWTRPLLAAQVSPIRLTSHVDPDDPNLTVEVGPLRPHRHRPASSPHAPPAAGPD
jgi:hypothetical protein